MVTHAPRQETCYLTPNAAQQAVGLVCLGAGTQQGRLPLVRDRVLGCYAVVLVTAGSGWLSWGAPPVTQDISAPSLFFLWPGLRHSYGPGPDGWAERWVLFDGAATAAYRDLGYLPRLSPLQSLGDVTAVRRVMDEVLAVCQPGYPNPEVEAAIATHQLLAAIHRARATARSGHAVVLKTLQDGALRRVPISQHARELGMPIPALRRAVADAAGCSPREYIMRARLGEAKALLAESDASIARVAALVGYDDPAYFSRFFTRRVGVTPHKFRQQARARAAPA